MRSCGWVARASSSSPRRSPRSQNPHASPSAPTTSSSSRPRPTLRRHTPGPMFLHMPPSRRDLLAGCVLAVVSCSPPSAPTPAPPTATVVADYARPGCPSCPVCPSAPPIEVHFSPKGGCLEAIVGLVDGAKRSVRVQAYSFTSPPIIEALVAAKRRGVAVEVLLDRSNRGAAPVDALQAAGVSVTIDASHPIAHAKVVLVDDEAVEFGSYNYTRQAERNAEDCAIVRDRAVAAAFLGAWREHRAHAEE